MADSRIIPIAPGFDMQAMVAQLTQMYQAKGFTVSVMGFGGGVSMDFRKDDDGIKKYVGMALGVKANITLNGGALMVDFTDAEWTGKIVGLAVGWFLCLVPFIIALVGCFKQSEFPKTIANDIAMIAGGGAPPQPQGGFAPPPPPYQQPPYEQPVAQTVTCPACGAAVAEGSPFCTGCGAKMG